MGDLKCNNVSDITPQMVEKNPDKYIGECVKWRGQVSDIKEAGEGMVYIIPVEKKYDYCGKTQLSISVNKSGKISGKWLYGTWLPDYDYALSLCEYLYSGELPNIFEKD